MNRFFTACALAPFVLACANSLAAGNSGQPAAVPAASTAPIPAGGYTLDKAHASLLFRVGHLGFSHYTGRFTRFDAQLQFDPANLPASSVKVTIDPRSLDAAGGELKN